MSGLVANKDVRWAASIGVTLRRAKWDKFFESLTALYAGAVYGSTEGRPHELSYAASRTGSLRMKSIGSPRVSVGC